ncbi:MAG: TlpA disulfide reductase family protein [Candidatus Kapaibacterium sp.]|nr:TlpA family protein disulfide reductase [Ignavibacteriota bacterium]MCB9220775.1 TlpA family protein disulfide reductase [Ignavibacteria bacterium]
MYRIIPLLAVIVFSMPIYAGNLVFNNEKPETGARVSITYETNESVLDSHFLVAYHFRDTQLFPTAEAYLLNESVRLFIDSRDNFILFKVINKYGDIDNNKGNYWDLVVHRKGTPVRNGYLNKAISYLGSTGENYTRIPNYDSIKVALEKELELYSDNFRAKLAYETLKLDFKLIKFQEYSEKLREILNTRIDINDELSITAAVKALNSLNEKDKANDLEQQFIKEHPKSEMSKNRKLEELGNVNSFEEFINNLSEYLNENYNKRDIESVYNSFVFAHSQSKELMDKLDQNLKKLNRIPAYLYNEIALTYLEDEDIKDELTQKEIFDNVIRYSNMGLSKLDSLYGFKPIDVSYPEWKVYISKNESELYLTQFKLHLITKDSINALSSVVKAIDAAPYQMNSTLYTEALELANKYNKTNQIKSIIENAYKNNIVDSDLEKFILNLISTNNSIDISFLNNVIESSKKTKLEKLKNSLTKETQLSGFVQNTDGTFADLDKLKGKVKVILIGSSWCDVCTEVYPIFNQLYSQFKDDKNVSIIGISIWEDDKALESVKDMITDFSIEYPNYIDNTDLIPRKFNVFGFPTIVIVDQDNYIRYTIRGYKNREVLIDLVNDFVRILD